MPPERPISAEGSIAAKIDRGSGSKQKTGTRRAAGSRWRAAQPAHAQARPRRKHTNNTNTKTHAKCDRQCATNVASRRARRTEEPTTTARRSHETTGWRMTMPCEASRPGNRLGSRKNRPRVGTFDDRGSNVRIAVPPGVARCAHAALREEACGDTPRTQQQRQGEREREREQETRRGRRRNINRPSAHKRGLHTPRTQHSLPRLLTAHTGPRLPRGSAPRSAAGRASCS